MPTSLLFRTDGRPSRGVHRCALGFIAVACLSTSASTVVGTRGPIARNREPELAPCGPLSLRLRLLTQAGEPDADTLVVARQEATAIWAEAGLGLVWRGEDDLEAAPEPTVTIVVRRTLVPRAQRTTRSVPGSHGPLAWALFVGLTPTDLIEVSFPAIAALVLPETFAGKRIADLPLDWRRRLLGRALGRVIAHEVGHWLWGPPHARTGLMMPAVGAGALVAMHAPALPRLAIGADGMRRLNGAAGCPPALATVR